MDLFYPSKQVTVDKKSSLDQAFLIQSLLPHIANSKNKNKIYKFFKEYQKQQINEDYDLNKRIIYLNTSYGCNFESELRFSSIDERNEHIEMMQNLTTVQKAALVPYIRMYLVPNPYTKSEIDLKRNAIPLAFGKSFDLNFYLDRREGSINDRLEKRIKSTFNNKTKIQSASRGELAAIQSMNVSRVYNQTNIFDPIDIDMSFYFSSFNVFAHKPAIEASSGFNTYLNRLSQGGGISSFFKDIKDLRYTELITLQNKDYKLVLEYGWNIDNAVSEQVFNFRDKARIKKFEKSFYLLNPQDHSINFNEDGSFTMNVKYVPSTIDSVFKSVDFKTGIFFNEKIYKKIKGATTQNIRDKVQKIKLLQKIQYSDPAKEIKRLKDVSKLTEELSNLKSANYINLFDKFVKESKLNYSALIETSKTNDNKYTFKTTLARKFRFSADTSQPPIGADGKQVVVSKTYDPVKIRRDILQIREKNKLRSEDLAPDQRLKSIDFLGLSEKFTRFDQDAVEEERDEIEELEKEIFNDLLTLSDRKILKFMFFRDILSVLVQMAKVAGQKDEIPYFVLGNFPMPLPNGRKYWCNVGDIPVEMKILKATLRTFFNQRPKASFKDFLYYFLQDVFPSLVVQRQQRSALPTISFPFFHFNQKKWIADSKTRKNYTDLIDGKKGSLKKFAKSYFNDADFDGSIGCLFVGQTPRLSIENSGFYLGRNVKIASEAFLKDDNSLLKVGIGKMIIGSSNGLVKNLRFNSSGDQYINNLNYELNKQKPGVGPILISSAYQYTVNATLYGNRIHEFSNLIYIPAGSIGYSPLSPQDALKRVGFEDFEIGGLYVINNIRDQIDLKNGTYVKNISASTVKRESQLVSFALELAKKDVDKEVLFPTNGILYNFAQYIYDNSEVIDQVYRIKIKTILGDIEAGIVGMQQDEMDELEESGLLEIVDEIGAQVDFEEAQSATASPDRPLAVSPQPPLPEEGVFLGEVDGI